MLQRGETEWLGWIWCTDSSRKSAWVPRDWVEIEGDSRAMKRDYDAVELSADKGEMLTVEFDRDTGTLVVEADSPLAANQISNYFPITVRRAMVTTNATIHGVPIASVDFMPRPPATLRRGRRSVTLRSAAACSRISMVDNLGQSRYTRDKAEGLAKKTRRWRR